MNALAELLMYPIAALVVVYDILAGLSVTAWAVIGFFVALRQLAMISNGVWATRAEVASLHERIIDIEADRKREPIEVRMAKSWGTDQ